MEIQGAAVRNNGMLPTPAKTPQKAQSKNAPAITAVARNLFPVHGGNAEEVRQSNDSCKLQISRKSNTDLIIGYAIPKEERSQEV
jgi:hypothetical protein